MKPSLGRRLIGALLVAYALVAVLLVAWNFWTARAQLTEQSVAHHLGRLMVASLEGVQDENSARAVVQGFARELRRLREESGYAFGTAGIRLSDAQGRPLWSNLSNLTPLAVQPALGLSRVEIGPHRYTALNATAGRWQVLVLDQQVPDAVLLQWVLEQILVSLLIALPVLLLTLWLAVRTGLGPLRRFTARIAALDTRRELAALNLDLRYAELQPLGAAFDALLARLREQLARERAFVHDAAHELRTPLAALGAQAHVLLHSGDEAGRAQAAQALQSGLARTAHLSQQLLDMARLDQERPAQPEALDLAELAAQALRQAHREARARGVELALQGPPELKNLPWHGERQALQSLLHNLLDNAIRYGARQVELQIGLHHDGHLKGRPWLAVADDGPGVAPEHREAMFERFWRGPQAQQTEASGSGLGLSIVRQALQRLGAQLQLGTGLAGRGLRFQIDL
ncbi:signal transduction histidine kinase [Inhella inkyongensis]|uniref:histidine kinase n=1 Tax=Inhella inkyongensis TaxID=392593 RepID=A0A840SCC2_9BURK|nr:ATP-binding protein [Inhella inkyongensis]MBB5205979.1 signal transduction histidine kinase [Inhella inkyongensis]